MILLMDEFLFIDSIRPKSYRQPSVQQGIGDDGAVIRQTAQDMVIAVDTMVEGIHFLKKTMSPYDIGFKSLAANVSDLAAMGAAPACYLVSVTVSPDWKTADVQDIFRGMKALGDTWNMDLIGGDTVTGGELSVTVTVLGFTQRDRARYRFNAQAGDVIFVTGTLGDSQAGLHLLMNPNSHSERFHGHLTGRHQRPMPRVDFSLKLAHIKRLALNDISDGLASEANEIAERSDVDMHLEEACIPKHPALAAFEPELQTQWSLYGGEDYELLGTVSTQEWDDVQKAAQLTGTPVQKIGIVKAKSGEQGRVYLKKDGISRLLQKKGYNHFK